MPRVSLYGFHQQSAAFLIDSQLQVSYKVPLSAHLQKPFTVAIAFFGLFALTLFGRRIDLTINKKKVS